VVSGAFLPLVDTDSLNETAAQIDAIDSENWLDQFFSS
jgi:hypothetical protein